MSDSSRENRSTLNRRQMLRLSTTAGVGAALPGAAHAFQGAKATAPKAPAGTCSTPRAAVANTQYGKVRGYLEDDVLTFKGVPYGAPTGGGNRWLPAKPPKPWDGEYPALTYGANCPQRLHDWPSEQTFLQQWTDGWQSEDMLKVNIWTPGLTGKRPVMFYIHGGGFTFGSAYELASQDGAQMARHHDVVSVTELKFGDNDNLSALVTNLGEAHLLVHLRELVFYVCLVNFSNLILQISDLFLYLRDLNVQAVPIGRIAPRLQSLVSVDQDLD